MTPQLVGCSESDHADSAVDAAEGVAPSANIRIVVVAHVSLSQVEGGLPSPRKPPDESPVKQEPRGLMGEVVVILEPRTNSGPVIDQICSDEPREQLSSV